MENVYIKIPVVSLLALRSEVESDLCKSKLAIAACSVDNFESLKKRDDYLSGQKFVLDMLLSSYDSLFV